MSEPPKRTNNPKLEEVKNFEQGEQAQELQQGLLQDSPMRGQLHVQGMRVESQSPDLRRESQESLPELSLKSSSRQRTR